MPQATVPLLITCPSAVPSVDISLIILINPNPDPINSLNTNPGFNFFHGLEFSLE